MSRHPLDQPLNDSSIARTAQHKTSVRRRRFPANSDNCRGPRQFHTPSTVAVLVDGICCGFPQLQWPRAAPAPLLRASWQPFYQLSTGTIPKFSSRDRRCVARNRRVRRVPQSPEHIAEKSHEPIHDHSLSRSIQTDRQASRPRAAPLRE